VVLVGIAQKCCHWSGVKGKDRGHVGTVELEECFVEDQWIRLVFNQLYDIWLGLADVETLEKKKLSQCDRVNLDTVNVIIFCLGSSVIFLVFIILSDTFVELLFNTDDLLFVSTLKENVVLWINFQEIHWFQWVEHSIVIFVVLNGSLLFES